MTDTLPGIRGPLRGDWQEYTDLSIKLFQLQGYINRMDIAHRIDIANLKDQINEACRLFPVGRDYILVVQNLEQFLPETIDSALRELLKTCADESLRFVQKSQIISQTTVILEPKFCFCKNK